MEAFRQKIAADPDRFLDLLRQTELSTGISVTAEVYKRPKPAENPVLAPYFAWKADIGCIRNEEVGEAMFGPALGDRSRAMIEQLIPLYDYFCEITSMNA